MSNKKDQVNDFKKAISSTLRAISKKKDIDKAVEPIKR